MKIDKTLAEREITHGNYKNKAIFIQGMKCAMRSEDGWWKLDYDMQESLDMIATKIARILIGNANHVDNWHDIAGYSQLIVNRLQTPNKLKPAPKRKK
jgi:hypothetical protein